MKYTAKEEFIITGKLLIAGGNLTSSKREIHKLLIEYAGGIDSKLVIVPTSSALHPDAVMDTIEDLWIEMGIHPDNIIKLPIFADKSKNSEEAQGDNDDLLQILDGVTGFWFIGGDQYYLSKAFIRKDGTDTKILESMKNIYRNGGVIGGSSAGAAIMSSVMIASGNNKNSLSGLAKHGYEDYSKDHTSLRLVKGLGFFPEGVVDQHVDARPRMLRLIRAAVDCSTNLHMGYGVSEDTAMIYNVDTKLITVIGSGALYIFDCSKIKRTKRENAFTFQNVILHVIKEGDSYNTIEKHIEFMC